MNTDEYRWSCQWKILIGIHASRPYIHASCPYIHASRLYTGKPSSHNTHASRYYTCKPSLHTCKPSLHTCKSSLHTCKPSLPIRYPTHAVGGLCSTKESGVHNYISWTFRFKFNKQWVSKASLVLQDARRLHNVNIFIAFKGLGDVPLGSFSLFGDSALRLPILFITRICIIEIIYHCSAKTQLSPAWVIRISIIKYRRISNTFLSSDVAWLLFSNSCFFLCHHRIEQVFRPWVSWELQ